MELKTKKTMERKGIYDIKKVLDWAETDISNDTEKNFKEFDGLTVLSGLLNYKIYKHVGVDCKTCSTKGKYFALERTPGPGRSKYNNWHFNLYGENSAGKEVLLTKDHIKPKSGGGTDDISNLQPMCSVCNTKKGSMHMVDFELLLLGKPRFDWDHKFRVNVISRLKERYSIDVDYDEYEKFCNLVKAGKKIHSISKSKSYIKVEFRDKTVYAVYSNLYHTIYSVLDPSKIEEHILDTPTWGVGREEECKEIYNKIKSTIESEFKEFETPKETGLYLSTCTYKKIMNLYWKNRRGTDNTHLINIAIWKEVKDQLK